MRLTESCPTAGRLALALALPCLLHSVAQGQVPTIIADKKFYLLSTVTLRCEVTSTANSAAGHFPLTWSRKSTNETVLTAANESVKAIAGDWRQYVSCLLLTVEADFDGDEFICTARFSGSVDSAHWGVRVLPPRHDPNILAEEPFVVGEETMLTCALTTSLANPDHIFPLQWTRASDPDRVINATNETSRSVGPTFRFYSSDLRFQVERSMNLDEFYCRFMQDSASMSSQSMHVVLPPEVPVISGPSAIVSGQGGRWECAVTGASGAVPRVYWQHGDGSLITPDGQKITSYRDPQSGDYMNQESVLELHDVCISLSLTLPGGSDDDTFTLLCVASHNESQTVKTSSISVIIRHPPRLQSGSHLKVNTNQLVTIQCNISSTSDVISVTWYKDDDPIVPDPSRYSGGSVEDPSLTIRSAEEGDSGNYTCTATNDDGEGRGRVNDVHVRDFLWTTCNTSVEEGSDVICSCHTSLTDVIVTWPGHSEDTVLNLSNVQLEDNSTFYTCSAIGNASGQPILAHYILQVVPKPNADLSTFYVANLDQQITINCIVSTESRTFSIAWYKNSILLHINPFRYSGGTLWNTPLTILQAKKEDSGNYTCRVTYKDGDESEDGGQLTVGLFLWTTCPSLVEEQTSFTCECLTNLTDLNVTWYGHSLVRASSGTVSGTGGGMHESVNNVLSVHEVTLNDAFTSFTCIAVGKVSTQPLLLHYVLNVVRSPTVRMANVNQQITVTCNVSSDLDITSVTWYKDGIPLALNSSRYTGGTTDVPALTIPHTEESDSGNYKCHVTNQDGEGFEDLGQLTVGQFLRTTCPRFVEEGICVTCHCESALRGLTVTWPGYSSNAVLEMGRVGAHDNGTIFACVAANESQSLAVQHVLQVSQNNVTDVEDSPNNGNCTSTYQAQADPSAIVGYSGPRYNVIGTSVISVVVVVAVVIVVITIAITSRQRQ